MFDSANLDHVVDKATFDREAPKLREALLNAQYDLSQKKISVLILVAGVEGAGKSETVNMLNEWMDPRHISTSAFGSPSDEERERPPMYRFWRALPPRGKIGIFFGGWHTEPILGRVLGSTSRAELDQRIAEILRFERMLSDEGVLVLKFWHHLTKEQQRKRLKSLSKDPRTRWRVTETDWKYFKLYDRFARVAEGFTRHTSTGECPWIVVSGADARYRTLTVAQTVLAAMRERLDEKPSKHLPDRNPPLLPPVDKKNVLRALTLDRPAVTKKKYEPSSPVARQARAPLAPSEVQEEQRRLRVRRQRRRRQRRRDSPRHRRARRALLLDGSGGGAHRRGARSHARSASGGTCRGRAAS
ncbi:MAG: hypothetical protein U0235_31510 [Polyangiaceae bacterium]